MERTKNITNKQNNQHNLNRNHTLENLTHDMIIDNDGNRHRTIQTYNNHTDKHNYHQHKNANEGNHTHDNTNNNESNNNNKHNDNTNTKYRNTDMNHMIWMTNE